MRANPGRHLLAGHQLGFCVDLARDEAQTCLEKREDVVIGAQGQLKAPVELLDERIEPVGPELVEVDPGGLDRRSCSEQTWRSAKLPSICWSWGKRSSG